jgi:hypothetical protein
MNMQTKFPIWKLAVFGVLSACDFVITYLLISRSQGQVYESNPVADQWLQQGGWIGLAAFKAAIVFGVSMIATYIYYRRPRIAHDLLAIACGALVVAVVTGSSIAMTRDETPTSIDGAAWNPRVTGRTPRAPSPAKARDYQLTLDDSAFALAANCTDLAHAVAELEKSNRGGDPKWIESLQKAYPGIEVRALFAADLMQHAISMRIRAPKVRELAARLEREFIALYGFEPNLPYRPMMHLTDVNDSYGAERQKTAGIRVR